MVNPRHPWANRWVAAPNRAYRQSRFAAGYNLVILVMAITTLSILVGMALPVWSHLIRREKEEELIFRGLQYAEAIRVFQQRHQRLPVRLDELLKVEPRSIRQLWPNPMREDGKWSLIFQAGQQPGGGQGGGNPRRPRPGGVQGGGTGNPPPGRPGQEVTVGPILGVYSADGGEAVKTWNNSNNIADWQFRADLLNGVSAVQEDGSVQVRPVNTATIGRPWPPGVTPQNLVAPVQGGLVPPGGIGGKPPKPPKQPGLPPPQPKPNNQGQFEQ